MQNDRSAVINIGGDEYELLLTTLATKEIAKKYGGIENLGEQLSASGDFGQTLDDVIWLIVLLANQCVLIHNYKNKEDKKELLTAEAVELLTTPTDLADFKDAIMAAVVKGAKRNIESEDDEKNKAAG